MNKVIPKISSGNLLLLVSETVCFDSAKGLSFAIPTQVENSNQPGKDIIFNFAFAYGDPVTGEIKSKVESHGITVSINNFGVHGIFSANMKPLTFQFGNIPIALYFSGQSIPFKDEPNHRFVHLSVTIYQGEVK